MSDSVSIFEMLVIGIERMCKKAIHILTLILLWAHIIISGVNKMYLQWENTQLILKLLGYEGVNWIITVKMFWVMHTLHKNYYIINYWMV